MEHLQPTLNNPLSFYVMKDQEDFEPLMPKAIDKLGGIGKPEKPVTPPVLDPRSIDPMEVVDIEALAEEA